MAAHQRLRVALCWTVLAIGLTGCAVGGSVVDIAVPTRHEAGARETVTIIEIRDLRQFAVAPGDAMLPSLSSKSEAADPSITERIIGRKRNAYGMKLGEVMLPEGQTVTGLIRDAVTAALGEQGYAVAPDLSAGAIPLSVDVEQFWAWFEPGALQATVEFESRVRIYGPIVLDGPSQTVRSGMRVATPLAVDATWQQVVQSGLDTLVTRIKEEVKPASPTNFATTGSEASPSPALTYDSGH